MLLRKSSVLLVWTSVLAGLLPSLFAQSLTSLLVTGGDHAYYVDTNQHVDQLYWNGQTWVSQDLTVLSRAATLAAAGSTLTSVLVGNSDHIYYVDANQHVNQLFYNGQNWVWQDLTAASGATNVPA